MMINGSNTLKVVRITKKKMTKKRNGRLKNTGYKIEVLTQGYNLLSIAQAHSNKKHSFTMNLNFKNFFIYQ